MAAVDVSRRVAGYARGVAQRASRAAKGDVEKSLKQFVQLYG
jgi:hypothetical protein